MSTTITCDVCKQVIPDPGWSCSRLVFSSSAGYVPGSDYDPYIFDMCRVCAEREIAHLQDSSNRAGFCTCTFRLQQALGCPVHGDAP